MNPIALFCFKRIDTLVRCVDSLKKCPESLNSDLIIFSDAGRNQLEQEKVDVIRTYLQKISGFKSIRIIHRIENFGVDYNIICGIQEMAERFESFIVVEDDLVVSNQFLLFMNAGLSHFKDFDKVLTLSAFNFVKIPKNYLWDCYFVGRANSWGWATWSNKIKEVDWDLAHKENFVSNSEYSRKFNAWGSDLSRMLKRTLNGEIRAWDIRLEYYLFRNNFFSVYSTKNLILNTGFNRKDASNTTGFNRYKTEFMFFEKKYFNFPESIMKNTLISKRFIRKNNLFNRIVTSIYKFLNIQ